LGIAVGALVGTTTAVAATGTAAVAAAGAATGIGVAVDDEPQAKMAANNIANGPRIIILGLFNQCFKIS
jgi:hypothetical protein